jgi:uncharacterized protein (DUF58 family)
MMKIREWIRQQFRNKPRIYIFPTNMGGYLLGLIFLMLMLSIGYNNNLLLIFTLFLFTFNLVWLLQTYSHLKKLKVKNIKINPGHAKKTTIVNIGWEVRPKDPCRWNIDLESDLNVFTLKNLSDSEFLYQGEILLNERGLKKWNYLKISSDRPFGLYYVWIYLPINIETITYPALLKSIHSLYLPSTGEGEISSFKRGDGDYFSFMPYAFNESRKISWKHYASTGELLIKEGTREISEKLDIKFSPPTDNSSKEYYLSQLATQMIECQRQGITINFITNEDSIELEGPHQLQQCLRILALC